MKMVTFLLILFKNSFVQLSEINEKTKFFKSNGNSQNMTCKLVVDITNFSKYWDVSGATIYLSQMYALFIK